MTIPEIAAQIVNKTLLEQGDDNSRTIFLVGSKGVGKSTLLYSFLDKPDTPKETLVLEYSFGRKSNQKQGIEKTICHVWEYGGKLDLLKTVLSSVPVRGKYFYSVMVDLSKIKSVWPTLETCIQAMVEVTKESNADLPELVIVCGKYDIFKNYDSEIRKIMCTTLRSVALVNNAHLLFYSSKEAPLVRRVRDVFHSMGFGGGVPSKEKNSNYSKPLVLPRSSDSWESIGIAASTMDQIKSRHISRITSESELPDPAVSEAPRRSHPEPALDALVALKYEELRNLETLDISIDDYLLGVH